MGIELERVVVPAGPFLYGEEPVASELSAFAVGRDPVTNGQYAAFVSATGREPPKHWKVTEPPPELVDHPVVYVTWFDAGAFAAWVGGRLLAEEEWEKAARGVDGRRFPWGTWDAGSCNSKDGGLGRTSPVGRFSPRGDSPYGCRDMAGNVQEWTSSVSEKYRILRGGAYNHVPLLLEASHRVRHRPNYASWNIGFRVGWDV